MLDELDEAKTYYQDALEVVTNMRFRPEIALTRFQLAEQQLEHYPDERSEAIEQLSYAIDEFKEMKTQPSVEKTEEFQEKYGIQKKPEISKILTMPMWPC
jgi:hypothetical protein